jgi:CheY-like chemotaxis protein/anti-sigma regulatory factor (Ser/Thr protein kinase)
MEKILVVDDSAVDRRLARNLLEGAGKWEIDEAVNGRQALELIVAGPPHLVLTDMQMPEMNGLELVDAMRSDHPLIPVILMTGQGNEQIAVKALQKGAASYIPKRILVAELVEVVQRVLDVSREELAYSRLMSHMTLNDCRFSLANDLALIASVVGFLRNGVTQMKICDAADQFRVAVALEEALLNAYYHGNLEVSSKLRENDHRKFCELASERVLQQPYSERRIHMHAMLEPEAATFVIRDEGPGFDPATLPDPTDPENLVKPCGRGVLLMKAFMDEVSFNAKGNQVTMVKRRGSSDSNGDSDGETGSHSDD